jgi:hypothetical protein
MAGPNDVRNYEPTEYGGNAGLVETEETGHVLKPREVKMMFALQDNPADPQSGQEFVARFESAG